MAPKKGQHNSILTEFKSGDGNCRYWLGKKRSNETKLKISMSLKGHSWSRKGASHTEESKRRMSKSHKGKIISEVTKEKLRQRGVEFFKRISILGIEKQQNSKEPTSIEKAVYDFLKSEGVVFEKQRIINGKFLVDAFIPNLNVIIECDGDYWHSSDKVKKRDKSKNAYLTKCGYNLIRLSESQIKNGDFIQILKREVKIAS